MYKALYELYHLLTTQERRHFLLLQALVVLMAILEVVGVMSIGPFMGLVADSTSVNDSDVMRWLYTLSAADSHNEFLIYVGTAVIMVITLASIVSIVTVWQLSRFGAKTGMDLGTRLFAHYMRQPWLFHASGNSSKQINNIVNEAARISSGIISPFLQLNAKAILALVLALSVFLYDPVVAVVGVSFFASAYLAMFFLIKSRLSRYSHVISSSSEIRMKLLNEAFGGIKDVLLKNKQLFFVDRFSYQSNLLAKSLSSTQILSQIPRYVMEFVALATVIVLIQVLLYREANDLAHVLPVLAIYAMAGLKLLPAFQQVYTSSSYIRGNISALKNLQADLSASLQPTTAEWLSEGDYPALHRMIALQGVNFRYPNQSVQTLKDVSLEIPVNQFLGVAGTSGSGKSTLADLLLGLIEPTTGAILVDGKPLNSDTLRAWRKRVAYVPQDIFLMDTSIAENIAFGCEKDRIDLSRVEKAIEQACLTDYVDALAEGIHAHVGERGVQLSGGQRQRMGIARALYHDFDLIIMDEATSALDGPTELGIVETLNRLKGQKTVVMIAHRLSTLEACDEVLYLEQGALLDRGHLSVLKGKYPAFFNSMENLSNESQR